MRQSNRNTRWGLTVLVIGAGLAGMAWAGTQAVDNRAAGNVTVVNGARMARPAPKPVAKAAATSAAAAAASVASVAVAEPVPYVLGSLTWTWGSNAPADKRAQISDSMNWAMNQLNTLANYSGSVWTTYNAGTPTAQASYSGEVRFGGQTNRRTALHELGHWLGSGGIAPFRQFVSGGTFNGNITNLRARGYDGPNARVGSDGTHFWPYGMNYDSEFADPQRTIGLVAAQRADMGFGDGTYAIAGNRRFQNRASRLILDAGTGGNAVQQPNNTASTQIWRAGYVDGYVTLTASNGKLALDSIGVTSNAGATAMYPALLWHPNQHWEMIPTDDGWFMLRNRGTGKCLDNNGNQSDGADMRLWSCSGHVNQQWHLVR